MTLTETARNNYDNHVIDPNDVFNGLESLAQHVADEHAASAKEAEIAVLQAHTERQHQCIANLRSNAASARDAINELHQANGLLRALVNSAAFTGDKDMANALTVIHKSQEHLYQQISNALS